MSTVAEPASKIPGSKLFPSVDGAVVVAVGVAPVAPAESSVAAVPSDALSQAPSMTKATRITDPLRAFEPFAREPEIIGLGFPSLRQGRVSAGRGVAGIGVPLSPRGFPNLR